MIKQKEVPPMKKTLSLVLVLTMMLSLFSFCLLYTSDAADD